MKQAEALAAMRGRGVFALFMEMRTGKTKVVIDDWELMIKAGVVCDLLLLAPAGCYRTWETAIPEDLDDAILARTVIRTWISSEQKKTDWRDFLSCLRPRILLMNIEALSTVAAARELCLNFLTRPAMIAVDESVCIKSHKSKRTKFVVDQLAPLATAKRILSGLPNPKSPLDYYSQFEFLDPDILGYASYAAFERHFAIKRPIMVGKRRVDIVVGYKNTEELSELAAPYVFRCRVKDCYDLPPATYAIREVPLTAEQKRVYAEFKKYATAKLASGEHMTATQVAVQITRLHQVLCGNAVDEEGVSHPIPENRTSELLELLEDHPGKAIIWCAYDADIHRVSAALVREFGPPGRSVAPQWPNPLVARFWGGNRASREDEERTFKFSPDCWYMVATAAAGGRGRTWDCANLTTYYSSTYDLDHRIQSEARPVAIGKTDPLLYVDLIARKTVDEVILKALREKIDLSAAILRDGWSKWVV